LLISEFESILPFQRKNAETDKNNIPKTKLAIGNIT